MQKIKKTFFTTIIFLCFVLTPLFFTEAAGLVPCGGSSEEACTICHLAKGIDNIITALMGWIATVAVIIIVVAGIVYIMSAGNPGMISTAKTALKNTLIGLAIALSAFVMIHYVLKAIGASNNSQGPLTGIGGTAWMFSCGTTGGKL